MKFSCTQENLHQGLQFVSHGAVKNVNLPILSNVLIRIADKALRLTTTNLEIAVTATVRGKVEADGECTVPSKLLTDYVALLPNDRVDVEVTGDTVHIASPSSKTKIKGIPAAEFPVIPKVDGSTVYRVPAQDLRKALSRVIFAVSPSESRPKLAGVFFQFAPKGPDGTLTLAATDSYRLAEARVALHATAETSRGVIVPARTASELLRILGAMKDGTDGASMLEIIVADNQILFRTDAVELVSRTIEEEYPDYKAVIPENPQTSVTVRRDEFTKGVKTSALFSRAGIFDVHLTADPDGKRLVTRSADSQTGENESVLLGDVTGAENGVTLNHRYLLDGLAALPSEQAVLKIVDATAPCVLTSAGDDGYRYVIMPIKQ